MLHRTAAGASVFFGIVVISPGLAHAEVSEPPDSSTRFQEPIFTAKTASEPVLRSKARAGSTFFSDGFEAGMGNWLVSDLSGMGAQWGDWDCWASEGARSAGCAAAGAQAVGCGEDYRNGMKTWMVYGPFDVAEFVWAECSFTFELESEPGFDAFFAGISTDGIDFSGSTWDGRAGETVVLDLPLEDQVWIGFQFVSDPSAGRPHGAQVDDVIIRTSTPGAPGGFGWTLSDSDVDPRSNTGDPGIAQLVQLYLWFYCADPVAGGVQSAEFSIHTTSGTHIAFAAMNGFLNAGSFDDLLLATSCQTPPIIAGSLLFIDEGGGIDACIGPSPTGWRRGVDCNALLWPVQFVGYDSTPARDPCQSDPLCAGGPSAIESRSWGSVKALYR
jgi:hypothetical protein